MAAEVGVTSPLQPNQIPPVSRRAARTPTARPPAAAALAPVTGETRFETTTIRPTMLRSSHVLPDPAQTHRAVDQTDMGAGQREIPSQFIGVSVDAPRQ